MTSERPTYSADDLRDQLNAADIGGGGGARISRSADHFSGRFAVAMGLLIAAYLLVVVYIYPNDVLWLDVTVTAAFVASIVGATKWHSHHRRASSRGWAKRYSVGFSFSIGLFGLGVALLYIIDSQALWLWLPYAVLTATPLVAASLMRATQ